MDPYRKDKVQIGGVMFSKQDRSNSRKFQDKVCFSRQSWEICASERTRTREDWSSLNISEFMSFDKFSYHYEFKIKK